MSDLQQQPPRWAERFFRWYCHARHMEALEGDLYEYFERNCEALGLKKARRKYVADVLLLLRLSVVGSIFQSITQNSRTMLAHYVRSSARGMHKRKVTTAIHLVGLITGMVSVGLIGLYVAYERGFDLHIAEAEQKFRVTNIRYGIDDGSVRPIAMVPPMYATALRDEFPEVKRVGQTMFDFGGSLFQIEEEVFQEENGMFADADAFRILDLELVFGSLDQTAEANMVYLSESTFRKFFGDVGYQDLALRVGRAESKVAGVFKDLPSQSHLKLDYIFSHATLLQFISEQRMGSWSWQQWLTYVELNPGADPVAFEAKFNAYVDQVANSIVEPLGYKYESQLTNVRDIHLTAAGLEWDMVDAGNQRSIGFLSVAGGIILLIALLNFINLSTAQALNRAKEVGVRKFNGARRHQLITQFTMESVLLALVSAAISLGLIGLLLPSFAQFTAKPLSLQVIFTVENITLLLASILGLGIMAGAYPALLLSQFKPIAIIRGIENQLATSGRKVDLRLALVGVQFVLTIGLVISSLVIREQFQFLQQKDLGFQQEGIIVMEMPSSFRQDPETTRDRFLAHPNVLEASWSYGTPGGIVAGDLVVKPEDDRSVPANLFCTDGRYLSTMSMELLAGRMLNPDLATDVTSSFVLNESMVGDLGYASADEAVGQPLHWQAWVDEADSLKRGTIIGVVKDFHFKSLHEILTGTVIHIWPDAANSLTLRVSPQNLEATLSHLQQTWEESEAVYPFTYEFLDQRLAESYLGEQRLNRLFLWLTSLAILTACIGLFGLVNHHVIKKVKEISVRKVLGAHPQAIFKMLVGWYFVLLLGCFVVATPLSIWLANQWLADFAYATTVSGLLLLKAACIVILLTLLTVSSQVFKGLRLNPIDGLRNE
ncbi:MAG: FtsX-like permease family protein [Bacteroidota bacterium]